MLQYNIYIPHKMRKNMLKFVTKGQSQTVNLFLKSTKKGDPEEKTISDQHFPNIDNLRDAADIS